jgi:hypothetical protein
VSNGDLGREKHDPFPLLDWKLEVLYSFWNVVCESFLHLLPSAPDEDFLQTFG